MIMKYKYLGKMLSKDEMKNVKGGNISVTGCVAICTTQYAQGSNTTAAYNVASCTVEFGTYICPPSDHLDSCSCQTVHN